jgi:type I restriction enzyme, R subunit
MSAEASTRSNFGHLAQHDEQLVRLGMLAERYFADDPNTSMLKLRQHSELLAQLVAAKVGLFTSSEEAQYELLRRLQDQGILPREIAQLFGEVRRSGNAANHAIVGDHRTALSMLKVTWQLGVWFHRTFSKPDFKSGPFVPPTAPKNESAELRAELDRLTQVLVEQQAAFEEKAALLTATEAQLTETKDEQVFWEQMALESDQLKAELETKLADAQLAGASQSKTAVAGLVTAAKAAADSVELDEAETRELIDEQLRIAGWTVDTKTMRFANGTRPKKGENRAIAEWPTNSGPADYVLFVGLVPMATVEAKRKNLDVAGKIPQAERYSHDFKSVDGLEVTTGPWGDYQIPFAFSSNSRPFFPQLATRSGIWFRDLRRSTNISRALDGWYTPEGLVALAAIDDKRAHELLSVDPFEYGFPIRDYQREAIQAVEGAIETGRREMLLAMATGTGKTKTCVALIYRLLKSKRFRRVLFVVDRSALGEQAVNAFKDTRMESLQNFADVFGIKELDDQGVDSDTAVHVATIQGLVARVQGSGDGVPPAVDQYDCIVVDECHRGYLLDRDLSDTEMTFRGFDDYVSKYRRALEHFDAVKIGLTATPALHTTQIFGVPIFTYSYRKAVIEGFLADHEPPIQIKTQLSDSGIIWNAGEEVTVYDPSKSQLELFTTPDEIRIQVEDFNRKVITESFNRVVCDYLATEIDPTSLQKTLIFCVNDAHADLVVDLLKQAFANQYGEVDDDSVKKITGAADKPLALIRRYKNERVPNVAVTVDLLTTGIDVPEICNIVFLRRVNSRILFDQMLGRATRLCDGIGKEAFRIFDAVRIYEALANLTAMQPVVVDPSISFTQLSNELTSVTTDDQRRVVLDQFIAKLQRKKRHLNDSQTEDFETSTGMDPDALIAHLQSMTLAQVATWFTGNPSLGEILDRKIPGTSNPTFVSGHADSLVSTERGYGNATKPEDYIQEFKAFIAGLGNTLPALVAVLTRPGELTRKQLRELAFELDRGGFSEASLATAWREMTNQDVAARIVGYIRQAALGDALIPYEQRVEKALQSILASRTWTKPQRDWLLKIASQTKANLLVDMAALDDPDLIFRREGGGFQRLDKIFNGQLQQVLGTFNDSLWSPAA